MLNMLGLCLSMHTAVVSGITASPTAQHTRWETWKATKVGTETGWSFEKAPNALNGL